MHIPSLKKNIALNLFKTLLSLLFPLVTFPYASRILLPEGIGKVNFADAIIGYFGLLATLGIHHYSIREAAKVRDDRYLLSKFSKEVLYINFGSALIAYSLLFISLFVIPKFADYRILLCVISVNILFTIIGMDWLYSAVEDYEYITIRYIIFHIISLVLLFLLVREQKDYLRYAAIAVFSHAGAGIVNFIHSRKYINLSIVHKLEFKRHIKPICILFAMAAAIEVYNALDKTMLGFICNDWEVGIYSAAVKVNKIVLSLVVAACSVLLPRLSYYSEKNEVEKFNSLTYKGLNILLLVSIPSCVGLCLVSYHIIILLSGEHYIAAVPVMRVMNPIILVIGMSNFIGMQLFMPLRKEKYTLYSVLCGAVVNFSLNLILVPRFQAFGAAVSTLCAETIVTIVQLFLARDIVDLRKMFRLFVIYLVNATVMGMIVFFVVRNINTVFYGFLCGVLTGIVIYTTLLLLEKNEIAFAFIKYCRNKIKC